MKPTVRCVDKLVERIVREYNETHQNDITPGDVFKHVPQAERRLDKACKVSKPKKRDKVLAGLVAKLAKSING